MTWQAVDGMHYAMVGGGGPGSIPPRAGKERAAQTYIGDCPSPSAATITPGDISVVRRALEGWGVTMVVIPDPTGPPDLRAGAPGESLATVMTAATGQAPFRQAGAWVWTGVDRAGPPSASTGRLTACAGGRVNTVAAVNRATACVLAPPSVLDE